MYQIFIVRHAKSDWNASFENDLQRPLNARGKHDAEALGNWLNSKQYIPDYVLHSPARRATETWQKIKSGLTGFKGAAIPDDRLYEASTSDLLHLVGQQSSEIKKLMLIGHNPGLEQLCILLCNGSMPSFEDGKILPTASIAIFELQFDWQAIHPGHAQLITHQRPATINKLA